MMLSPFNKLVLGTAQLGMKYGINNHTGQPNETETEHILTTAWNSGIRVLDTADAYGVAMERIGRYHANNKEKFQIITKFHADNDLKPGKKLLQTLSTLDVSSLYCYQFHRFADIENFPHLHTELSALKQDGLIQRIGVSVYTNEEIIAASDMKMIDVIQFPFNMLDNMRLRGEAMRYAKHQGKELHIRSVFLQGLFFKALEDIPTSLSPLLPYIQRLHRLQEKSNLAHRSIQALAMNYAVHNSLIDAVLFGVETTVQLIQILDALQSDIDITLVQEIEECVVEDTQLLNPIHWST